MSKSHDTTRTAAVRKDMVEVLKNEGGPIRQAELTQKLLKHNASATPGVIRGIFNGVQGISGKHKRVPGVAYYKNDDGSVFYYYESEVDFTKDGQLKSIKEAFETFEKELEDRNLLVVNLKSATQAERAAMNEFMKRFENLKSFFE